MNGLLKTSAYHLLWPKPLLLSTALATTLVLSACAPLPDVQRGEMLLDTERQVFCYSSGARCRRLGLIIANTDRNEILAKYGLDPWSWSQLNSTAELIQLLLNPPGDSYSSKQLDRFRFSLPVNEQTLTVWKVLDREDFDRYRRDDRCGRGPGC